MEIVVYSPEIAGNVGAIIRLSANSGVPVNFIKPFGFNMQENKIRRAGLDYHDLASVSMYENWNEFKKDVNLDNVGFLSSKGNKNIWDVELKNYSHLIFGPESIGLPENIIRESKNIITIPMNSDSRSINLANAVSIVAYEYLRQNYE